MRKRELLLLLLFGLLIRAGTAVLIPHPGYMDAAYYAAGAVRLAQGGGFSAPFIWNYLNRPSGIPYPGFLYWMPLPSLLSAPFALLFPNSFFALQIPFALAGAMIPLVAYGLAWQATRQRLLAWGAGLLALFSGFFFPYWTLPETFTPFAIFGGVALWLAGGPKPERGSHRVAWRRWLLVGLLVGLAHLTRADGILLLPMVALAALIRGPKAEARASANALHTSSVQNWVAGQGMHLLMVGLGYLLVMSPWFIRNIVVMGTPLSSASTRTIWLTEYDDLFCYECDLSLSSYLAWGWGNILHSKLAALRINFQRFLAEDCLIFLFPFVIVGLHRLRRRLSFLLASLYLVCIYLVHSIVFTFPGWRGSFFHASSAVLPFLYAAGMKGLDVAVRWAARRRRTWRYQQARTVFATSAVVAAIALSSYVAWQQISGWRKADRLYVEVDRWLVGQEVPDAGVMVGNPPAFWYHAQRPAVVIPNGDVDTLLEAADHYEMEYVLLEEDRPAPLATLQPDEAHHPRLVPLKTWSDGGTVLYEVRP